MNANRAWDLTVSASERIDREALAICYQSIKDAAHKGDNRTVCKSMNYFNSEILRKEGYALNVVNKESTPPDIEVVWYKPEDRDKLIRREIILRGIVW